MTALPWTWPPDGDRRYANYEPIRVNRAREGWTEVSVGPFNGYLPPDETEGFITAVRAAAGEQDCDPEVFEHGEHVAWIYGSTREMGRWVRAVAAYANARVDWRQIAGRGAVLHLGDAESRARVEDAITRLEPAELVEVLERFPQAEVSA